MEVIHTFWPQVVQGVGDLKKVIQGDVLPKILPEKSLHALVARSERNPQAELLMNILFSVQLFIVLFIFSVLSYTLGQVFLSLAAVEDDAPASYTLVAEKDAEDNKEAVDEACVPRPKPVTSSLRATYRHICSIEGKKSLFRGIACAIAYRLSFIVIALIFSVIPFIGIGIITLLVTSVLLVQLSAAWTHIIISEPSQKPFWHRLLSFKVAFRATALPTVAYYFCGALLEKLPTMLASKLIHQPGEKDIVGWALSLGIYLVISIFISIPTSAVLTRVQASLLPEEDQTIVPLDRALALHKAEGKEYMSMIEAWKSMPRASWIRLYKLYAKIWAVSVLFFFVVGLLFVAEFFIGAVIMQS